ncbi:unnamed protein product [Dovyalis caffra]|uniref:Uncharacterized protein n=1 Tax=Dovyalis caffra TaxID=77055 RepID=A0AAV1SRB9_9ROSI|nr:unnamed protein product [Dovyalis caffra]
MAASSPVISNNSSDTGQTAISAAASVSFSAPPKTLRGLNKPKCIQCGNLGALISRAKVAAQELKIHAIFMLSLVEFGLLGARKEENLSHLKLAMQGCVHGKEAMGLASSCSMLVDSDIKGANRVVSGGDATSIFTHSAATADVGNFRFMSELLMQSHVDMDTVLKANATPDKTPVSSTPLFDLQPNEVPPAASSHRAASLRQLSSNFSQFNNLHSPLRSRKPLTRKEAAAINEWRFSKMKEFKDRNIEVENEAFDRYMYNISLLEEVFSLKSFREGSTEDGSFSSNHDHASAEADTEGKMVSEQKLKLRSNPSRTENFRKRLQQIVDGGLKKLQKVELNNGSVNNQNELDKRPEKAKSLRAERASALSDLIDRLNKARNEEDLKSCLEMKAQLYSQQMGSRTETKGVEVLKEQTARKDLAPQKELDYFSQKLFRTVEIDHEALTSIDAHFSSLEKIEDL